jgi:KUP system potassium uptake protein
VSDRGHEEDSLLEALARPRRACGPPKRLSETTSPRFTYDGIALVRARFGYMEAPDVPAALRTLPSGDPEIPHDLEDASYFLSTIDLHRSNVPGLAQWRATLFLATARGAADAAQYFNLPRDRIILMGSRVEV